MDALTFFVGLDALLHLIAGTLLLVILNRKDKS